MSDLVAIDTETFLMGPRKVAPKLVCAAWCSNDSGEGLIGTDDDDKLRSWIRERLQEDELIFANASYDLSVISAYFPELIPDIFKALDAGRVYDVLIREKLWCISTYGSLNGRERADKSYEKFDFSLAGLEKKYFGIDRSEDKDNQDSWRRNFSKLYGIPAEDYPQEARDYVLQDVRSPLEIYLLQEANRTKRYHGSINTEALQVASDYTLQLMTCWGMITDQDRVSELEDKLKEELSLKNLMPLIKSGVLRPPKPPRPYKRQPGKWTKPQAASLNTSVLKKRVKRLSKEHNIPIQYTETGQISTSKDVIGDLAEKDEIIELHLHRKEKEKLLSTYLPPLKSEIVHPNFNVLVISGRTSSYGNPRNQEKQFYPSTNVQNWPRVSGEFSCRECFIARPGTLIVSCDYSALELCAVAEITYQLFNESVHRDKINMGYDLHAYLGSILALKLCPEFEPNSRNKTDVYEAFVALKNHEDSSLAKIYKKYRRFAKPTGLGYPGGLGPAAFKDYAKNVFGVIVSEDEAYELRNIWHDTYPEMREFFNWVGEQHDGCYPGFYCYETPLGMFRANAHFTEVANGASMQSRSAEGGKKAVYSVTKACYDRTQDSCLYGCHPLAYIHDEILLEIPDDKWAHERATELSRIMEEEMSLIMPNVKITAEPALMRRWYKEAEPVYNDQGRLIPWTP